MGLGAVKVRLEDGELLVLPAPECVAFLAEKLLQAAEPTDFRRTNFFETAPVAYRPTEQRVENTLSTELDPGRCLEALVRLVESVAGSARHVDIGGLVRSRLSFGDHRVSSELFDLGFGQIPFTHSEDVHHSMDWASVFPRPTSDLASDFRGQSDDPPFGYHHGTASMDSAIRDLASDFRGPSGNSPFVGHHETTSMDSALPFPVILPSERNMLTMLGRFIRIAGGLDTLVGLDRGNAIEPRPSSRLAAISATADAYSQPPSYGRVESISEPLTQYMLDSYYIEPIEIGILDHSVILDSALPRLPTTFAIATPEDLESCVICLCEDTREEDPWCQHTCRHWFHQTCARKWARRNPTCACCRQP